MLTKIIVHSVLVPNESIKNDLNQSIIAGESVIKHIFVQNLKL